MQNKKTVAICGLGYVGYPVAMLFASKGFNVIGFDVNQERVDQINSGDCPIKGKEPGLEELVNEVFEQGRFHATIDISEYADADYILIMVATPVNEKNEPVYIALRKATESIGKNMKKGVTVIIESTIAPGTMEKVVKPILEENSGLVAGEDFYLANCPERLMPGYLLENIREYNRVVGGYTPESAEKAKELYEFIVEGDLDVTSCITAEIVKTGENTYRDVQIAFANEMALLCEAMGSNVWDVREFINKCKKKKDTRVEALRQVHYPGAGVGGHCIPKDSWLLLHGAEGKVDAKIIPFARAINDSMPHHMFDLLKQAVDESGKGFDKRKVAVLGYAYDANSDDDRNTPTEPFLSDLRSADCEYEVHDPYVKKYMGELKDVLKSADAIVVMTAHDEYREFDLDDLKALMSTDKPIIVDGRNVFDKETARLKGFVYKGIGNI